MKIFCIRVLCIKLCSDRGTNVTKAKNQTASLCMSDLEGELKEHNCEWKLNTPKATHSGGVWEWQMKSVKNILRTCLHNLGLRVLNWDDLYTFLQECVCILSITPLWEYSFDPNNSRPLTPNMLLTLRDNLPTCDVFSDKDDLAYDSKRWRRVQYLSDQFFIRWKNDYLPILQARNIWTDEKRLLKPGDVVLVKFSNLKRC